MKARMGLAQGARNVYGKYPFASWRWWGGILCLGLSVGCRCDGESATKAQEKTLPPLVDVGVPTHIKAEIYPAIGAIDPRPVMLVFSAHPQLCSLARQKQARDVHVLCTELDGPAEQASKAPQNEVRMKEALNYLKERYARYVAGSPALLFCDEPSSSFCFQLMLREPAVFAHAYLPGLAPAQLTATTLYALFSGGTKTVILSAPLPANQAPLVAMAERGGLALKVVGLSDQAAGEALGMLRQQDPRLSGQSSRGSAAAHR